ncbi:shikimate kinase [uncultured Sunxiuqinia sp.]|uniref:shikimate kinase n=1 Tax=Sunxiuqinia rutila TaxID=1397841 RepID=UPI00262B24C1|nr:shikimate kinase [uncultured Sunxiuqinia sp.]
MKVFLIGYMGCGKSTLGRKLSEQLNIPFVDLDKYIEEKYFKSIPQIFAEEGETAFRKKEQKALMEVADFDRVIVATGGGAPCFFDNMELMNQAGLCVFLDVPTAALADRLSQSKTERPLIKGKSNEELLAFIENAMAVRRPFYEKAKCILKGDQILPEQIIAEIKN